MNHTVSQVLNAIRDMPDITTKTQIVKRYDSYALRSILEFGYNGNLTLAHIPAGDIPEDWLAGERYALIEKTMNSIPAFLEPGSEKEPLASRKARHEKGWINLVSPMNDRDRRWLIAAKDKLLPEALGLDHETLNRILPDIIPAKDNRKTTAFTVAPEPTTPAPQVIPEPIVPPTPDALVPAPTKARRKPGPKPGSKNRPKVG